VAFSWLFVSLLVTLTFLPYTGDLLKKPFFPTMDSECLCYFLFNEEIDDKLVSVLTNGESIFYCNEAANRSVLPGRLCQVTFNPDEPTEMKQTLPSFWASNVITMPLSGSLTGGLPRLLFAVCPNDPKVTKKEFNSTYYALTLSKSYGLKDVTIYTPATKVPGKLKRGPCHALLALRPSSGQSPSNPTNNMVYPAIDVNSVTLCAANGSSISSFQPKASLAPEVYGSVIKAFDAHIALCGMPPSNAEGFKRPSLNDREMEDSGINSGSDWSSLRGALFSKYADNPQLHEFLKLKLKPSSYADSVHSNQPPVKFVIFSNLSIGCTTYFVESIARTIREAGNFVVQIISFADPGTDESNFDMIHCGRVRPTLCSSLTLLKPKINLAHLTGSEQPDFTDPANDIHLYSYTMDPDASAANSLSITSSVLELPGISPPDHAYNTDDGDRTSFTLSVTKSFRGGNFAKKTGILASIGQVGCYREVEDVSGRLGKFKRYFCKVPSRNIDAVMNAIDSKEGHYALTSAKIAWATGPTAGHNVYLIRFAIGEPSPDEHAKILKAICLSKGVKIPNSNILYLSQLTVKMITPQHIDLAPLLRSYNTIHGSQVFLSIKFDQVINLTGRSPPERTNSEMCDRYRFTSGRRDFPNADVIKLCKSMKDIFTNPQRIVPENGIPFIALQLASPDVKAPESLSFGEGKPQSISVFSLSAGDCAFPIVEDPDIEAIFGSLDFDSQEPDDQDSALGRLGVSEKHLLSIKAFLQDYHNPGQPLSEIANPNSHEFPKTAVVAEQSKAAQAPPDGRAQDALVQEIKEANQLQPQLQPQQSPNPEPSAEQPILGNNTTSTPATNPLPHNPPPKDQHHTQARPPAEGRMWSTVAARSSPAHNNSGFARSSHDLMDDRDRVAKRGQNSPWTGSGAHKRPNHEPRKGN